MESALSPDLVNNAILTLCQRKESANIWLGEFQKSIHAWQICDNLLQEKRDLESCYFGAQTMRTKIQYSFHELPAESYFSLRDSLVDHLFHCDTNTNQAIVIQLCLALADLALQVPQWKDVVLNIIERFGQDPKHVFILMELLTVVPEEVNRRTLRLGANRREELSQEFSKQANAVLVVLAKIGEDAFRKGSDVLVKVFKCLGSWITLGVLPSDQISQHPLLQGTFQVLANVNTPAALHEAATDCIVEALILCENSTTHATLAQTLIQSVFNLEATYHACVANEDIDKLTNFCRLFTERAETVLMSMVDTPGDGLGNFTTLDLLLSAISYHDYSLAEMTFNFWYRLSKIVYQTDSGVLADVFKPYIERLLFALCKHCRFDADHEGVPSQNEEFCDFRKRVVECVRDVVFIMSSTDCFRKCGDDPPSSEEKQSLISPDLFGPYGGIQLPWPPSFLPPFAPSLSPSATADEGNNSVPAVGPLRNIQVSVSNRMADTMFLKSGLCHPSGRQEDAAKLKPQTTADFFASSDSDIDPVVSLCYEFPADFHERQRLYLAAKLEANFGPKFSVKLWATHNFDSAMRSRTSSCFSDADEEFRLILAEHVLLVKAERSGTSSDGVVTFELSILEVQAPEQGVPA